MIIYHVVANVFFSWNLKELYGLGGRTFLVLNLAPIGCYPAFLVELPHQSSDIDAFGCMVSYNNAVVDYNNKLKEALAQTRAALSDASVIYVDTHSILLELFQHPTNHGIVPLAQFSTVLLFVFFVIISCPICH